MLALILDVFNENGMYVGNEQEQALSYLNSFRAAEAQGGLRLTALTKPF